MTNPCKFLARHLAEAHPLAEQIVKEVDFKFYSFTLQPMRLAGDLFVDEEHHRLLARRSRLSDYMVGDEEAQLYI